MDLLYKPSKFFYGVEIMRKVILGIKKPFYWIDNVLCILPIVREHKSLRQLIRFVISGTIITVVDFGVYIFLTRIFLFWQAHYLWANFIAMAIAATGSFFLNKKWTFKDDGEGILIKYIKFWIVVLGGLVVYQVLFFVFVENIYIYDILAKAFAVLIVMFFRFIVQKFWVFR